MVYVTTKYILRINNSKFELLNNNILLSSYNRRRFLLQSLTFYDEFEYIGSYVRNKYFFNKFMLDCLVTPLSEIVKFSTSRILLGQLTLATINNHFSNLYNLLPKFINFYIINGLSKSTFTNSIYTLFIYLTSILVFLNKSNLYYCKLLNDLCVVDYFSKYKRFKLVYNLRSIIYNSNFFINIFAAETDVLPSVSHIFSCSNWLEREVWDMFGLRFVNHPDLRRILTDYGFNSFPLRKDFPLTGYTEIYYDDTILEIVYSPVELSQELRFFNFSSSWESDF